MKSFQFLAVVFLLAAANAQSTSLDELQSLSNGVFENVGLPDPVHEISCWDESDATLAIDTLGTLLNELSKNQIQAVISTAKQFASQLPSSVGTCIQNDPETTDALNAYKINLSDLPAYGKKALAYVTLKHGAFEGSINTMLSQYNDGEFTDLGETAGQLAQAILSFNVVDEEFDQ